ncbi:hypothetical protein C4D60_Mb08t17620 [Musa balbisiana]|uniref:Uncharacterized protein n=1 Tax=Musa balbisiana TaxID=52838 RepID=A0A4S8K4K4_MUSBA|nr:hypothetical protein C4D60_Mb08t17620 [Musa balbisiana]
MFSHREDRISPNLQIQSVDEGALVNSSLAVIHIAEATMSYLFTLHILSLCSCTTTPQQPRRNRFLLLSSRTKERTADAFFFGPIPSVLLDVSQHQHVLPSPVNVWICMTTSSPLHKVYVP